MAQSSLDLFTEDLIREHNRIRQELRDWKKEISIGPDLQNLKKFIDYYYSRIAVHAKLEEENLPVLAAESGQSLDTEAFVFAHENLDLHCRGLEETFRQINGALRIHDGTPSSEGESTVFQSEQIRVMTESGSHSENDRKLIIREVTELCDLIENHFQEEEHHLFVREMEEIYESSGSG